MQPYSTAHTTGNTVQAYFFMANLYFIRGVSHAGAVSKFSIALKMRHLGILYRISGRNTVTVLLIPIVPIKYSTRGAVLELRPFRVA